MTQNILDKEFDQSQPNNKTLVINLFGFMAAAILTFFALEFFRPQLPEYLYRGNGTTINTVGLIIFVVYLVLTHQLSKTLNQFSPEIPTFTVILYCGALLFSVEFIFLFMNSETSFNLFLSKALEASILWGLGGMLVSNISIHKLRNKSLKFPIILMIAVWIFFGILLTYS